MVVADIVLGQEVVDVASEVGRERAGMEVELRNNRLQQQPMSAGRVEGFTRPSPKVGLPLISKGSINQNAELMEALLAEQRIAQAAGLSSSGDGGINDELVQQILSHSRESGNEGMGGSGPLGQSASALKKLISGADLAQLLRDGVYVAQPSAVQANLRSSMTRSSWANSLGPDASESQAASAGPSFQSGVLLRSHTGQEEQPGPSDSKNLEGS